MLLQLACIFSSMEGSVAVCLIGQQRRAEIDLLQWEASFSSYGFQAANRLGPTMALCEYSSLLGGIRLQ